MAFGLALLIVAGCGHFDGTGHVDCRGGHVVQVNASALPHTWFTNSVVTLCADTTCQPALGNGLSASSYSHLMRVPHSISVEIQRGQARLFTASTNHFALDTAGPCARIGTVTLRLDEDGHFANTKP
jgi:hypothetical protein